MRPRVGHQRLNSLGHTAHVLQLKSFVVRGAMIGGHGEEGSGRVAVPADLTANQALALRPYVSYRDSAGAPQRMVQRQIPLTQTRHPQGGIETIAENARKQSCSSAQKLRDAERTAVDEIGGNAQTRVVEDAPAAANDRAAAPRDAPSRAKSRGQVGVYNGPERPVFVRKEGTGLRMKKIGCPSWI